MASGYRFIADQILFYDAQNPSLAARFCDVFALVSLRDPSRTQQGAQLRDRRRSVYSTNVRKSSKDAESGFDGARSRLNCSPMSPARQ